MSIALVAVVCLALANPAAAQSRSYEEDEGSTATKAGLGAASFLLTIPYGVTKVVFATAGGIVGGLAYIFSGADTQTAKTIWTTSAYGTYVITPDHLRGDKAVRFLGVAEGDASPYADTSRF